MNRRLAAVVVVAAFVLLGGAPPAHAYIGPGAGLGTLSAMVGVIVAVAMAVGMVLSWPIRLLIRRLRKGKKSAAELDNNGST